MIQSVRESDASLNSHKFTREEFQRLYQTVMPLNSEERRKLTGLDEKGST